MQLQANIPARPGRAHRIPAQIAAQANIPPLLGQVHPLLVLTVPKANIHPALDAHIAALVRVDHIKHQQAEASASHAPPENIKPRREGHLAQIVTGVHTRRILVKQRSPRAPNALLADTPPRMVHGEVPSAFGAIPEHFKVSLGSRTVAIVRLEKLRAILGLPPVPYAPQDTIRSRLRIVHHAAMASILAVTMEMLTAQIARLESGTINIDKLDL